ncbi:MAG: HD domain-containing protein [Candidatus Paceibacterota bacterium]
MEQELTKILKFTHELNKVKNLLRFKGMLGWENENIKRWDSVAEHSYRMALLAVMIAPYLKEKVSLEKVLKIILVHDIVEIIALDHNAFVLDKNGGGHAFDEKAFNKKYKMETAAAEIIFKSLPKGLYLEFKNLFADYINTKARKEFSTKEGRFAYALDKIEAVVQIIDWKKESRNWEKESFEKSMNYMHEWSDHEPVLKYLANLIENEGRNLVV